MREIAIALGCLMSVSAIAERVPEPTVQNELQEKMVVRVIREVKASGRDGWYVQNRAPLQAVPFMKLPVGNVVPGGWLRKQLELDADGLAGRIEEVSKYAKFDKTGWIHRESAFSFIDTPFWVSYWLRGYVSLAYVRNDPAMIANAHKWMTGVMATQDADGYFGPNISRPKTFSGEFEDSYTHMPMLYALRSYYEFSRDEKAVQCLLKYYKFLDTFSVEYFNRAWGGFRCCDLLNNIYWFYNITGEPWLLNLATKVQQNSKNWTPKFCSRHTVNIAQGIRQPGEYWQQAGDPSLLAIPEKHYQQIMEEHGQFPGGGIAGDENCRKGFGDPRHGMDACSFVEYMLTFESMTKLSGNPVWADRNEEIAFNSFPANLTPDHKAIRYATPANVIQLDDVPKESGQFQNRELAMLAYKAGTSQYACCAHNHGMGWPYYAGELWLATHDKGLCAMLYSASEVKAKVGSGIEVKLKESTDYPFADTVTFKLSTPKPVRFPLYLRIPSWCVDPTLSINEQPVEFKAETPGYVILKRDWTDGDRIVWRMPMHVETRVWTANKNSISVGYGPLWFSLNLGEKWEKDNFGGTWDPGTDAWPQWKVTATKPWNYGLVLNSPKPDIEVVRREGPVAVNPFTPETAPIELRVKAKRVPQWVADSENVVLPLPQSPVMSDGALETVNLIPLGAARLRISAFPAIGEGNPPGPVPEVTCPVTKGTSSGAVPRDTYIAVDISGASYSVVGLGESAPADLLTNKRYKTDCIVMRKIPAGTFTMGNPKAKAGEANTSHKVTLTQPFYISVFETTQTQYEKVMNVAPSYFKGKTCPVDQVSWLDVRGGKYPGGTPALSSFMGQMSTRSKGLSFDLPAEAQWEYACRSGTIRAYSNSAKNSGAGSDKDADLSDFAWHSYGSTHAVGGKQANAWGLYDMHGNVWEWCLDWYGGYKGDAIDPAGPVSGSYRVLRGGSCYNVEKYCSSHYRHRYNSDIRNYIFGFRMILSAQERVL